MSVWPHDLLELPALLAERGVRLGRPAHFLERAGSTQDEAKRGAAAGAPHGALWIADHQSQGRGRQGRVWQSAAGENALFSLLVRGTFEPTRAPAASLVAGLAVRVAVARALGDEAPVGVKWPNDVLVRGADGWRKLAGVLVEAQSRGNKLDTLIVGIGINVHTREFSEDLRATSVALAGQATPDRAALIADVLAWLEQHLEPVLTRGLGLVHTELERYDVLRDREVRGDVGVGVARGIDQEGRLRVEIGGEMQTWSFGEVHLEAPR